MLITSVILNLIKLRFEELKTIQKTLDTIVDERESMAFTRVTGVYHAQDKRKGSAQAAC